MSGTNSQPGYKSYWVTWGILLALTGIMLVVDVSPMSKAIVIGLLMAAMTLKAVLIGGQFMHLRFEKPGLIAIVAGSVIFLGSYLFILILFDALRISKMVKP